MPSKRHPSPGSISATAEVLLADYAEAQNEAAGPDQSVYTYLNQVSGQRAGMPDIPAGLTQAPDA